MAAILEREPAPLDLAPPLERVIRTCLAKDPDHRFQNALDLKRNLIWALEQAAAAPVTTASEGPTAARGRSQTGVWMAAFGVAALAFVTLAAVHFREKIPAAPAMHLTVPLPSTEALLSLALSPDGRTLLMTVIDKDPARSGLAVRPLDSDQIRLLPDAAGARAPFWSPDSKRIAFTESDNKLRVISASGGPAEVFEVSSCGCGGSWGSGGVILVANVQGQLERCDAERSRCSPLAGDPALKREFPFFLPDGNHFLFKGATAGRETGAASCGGIYVGSLDEPGGKRLLPDDSLAIYAPGHSDDDIGGHGFLLFRRDGALVGQAFDPAALTLSGDVLTIAQDLSRQMMASAASNGVLVYETGANPGNSQLTWLDRAGKVLSVAGPMRNQHAVAPSPQGNQILITEPLGSRDHGLWVRDAARDSESRLTSAEVGGDGGVWSPDGRVVAFGGNDGNIYSKDVLSGGNAELILKDDASKRPSDWSRDGRYLVFTEIDQKTNADIWVLPDPLANPRGSAGSGKPYLFQRTDAMESQAQFSPDGKWIAYTSNESGSDEVYVRPFPSGPGRWKVSDRSGFEPRWRSDGKELFYWTRGSTAQGSRMMAVPVKAGVNGSFASGQPQPLFEHGMWKMAPQNNWWSYSPALDGQRFLVLSRPDVQETIHVLSNWTQMFRGKP